MPKFRELPFNSRPDLTPYLLHMTKNTNADDHFSAFDNLVNILEKGKIWGSDKKKGFIRGPNEATCFMDVPFASLKYVLTPENSDPVSPRYEAYGIAVTKSRAYRKGCRPVLYLSNDEIESIGIPKDELWRVVRFETRQEQWISWLHEREWRSKGDFKLPSTVHAVLVKTPADADRLRAMIEKDPKSFKCKPQSIIPLTVMCQGLVS
ncbi:hypothetical protein BH10PSE12_BH10PSE12_08220 [soil metagenome]